MECVATNGIRILRPRKACEKLGYGRTMLHELVKAGELKPIQLGKRAVGFYEHELDAWLAARPRAAA